MPAHALREANERIMKDPVSCMIVDTDYRVPERVKAVPRTHSLVIVSKARFFFGDGGEPAREGEPTEVDLVSLLHWTTSTVAR